MKQTVDANANMSNHRQQADNARALAVGAIIFCVRRCKFARSSIPGNSRASERGTSNKYGLTLFLYTNANS